MSTLGEFCAEICGTWPGSPFPECAPCFPDSRCIPSPTKASWQDLDLDSLTLGTCYGYGLYWCPIESYIPEATLKFQRVANAQTCKASEEQAPVLPSSTSAAKVPAEPIAPPPFTVIAPPTGCAPSTKGLSCMQPLLGASLVLHWTVADTKTNFLIQTRTSGWVAFGPGSSMVGSQVVMGNLAGDTAPAVYSLGSYSPSDVTKASAQSNKLVVSAASVETVDGETLLSFTAPAKSVGKQSFIAAFGGST